MRSPVVPSCVHGMPVGRMFSASCRPAEQAYPMDAGVRNAGQFAGRSVLDAESLPTAEQGTARTGGTTATREQATKLLDTWRKDPMPKRMALRVIPSPQAQELVREGYEKTVDALLANLAMQDSLKRQVLIFGSALGYDAKAIDADIQTLKAA